MAISVDLNDRAGWVCVELLSKSPSTSPDTTGTSAETETDVVTMVAAEAETEN